MLYFINTLIWNLLSIFNFILPTFLILVIVFEKVKNIYIIFLTFQKNRILSIYTKPKIKASLVFLKYL